MICPHFPLSAPKEFYDWYDPDKIEIPKPIDTEYVNSHPWWKAFHKSILFDRYFEDDFHRRRAIANYYGLVSFADDNVGKIIKALNDSGLNEITRVLYTSDHGDNLGARGIWGKGTMHEESAGIPMIFYGPDIPKAIKIKTPVSLLDIYPTLLDCLGLNANKTEASLPGSSLLDICNAKNQHDTDREIISEYHGAGSTSGTFMLRKGAWKYIHYVGYAPELYNIEKDPEEITNLSNNPNLSDMLADLSDCLNKKLSPMTPETIDAMAKTEQAAHIIKHGGRDFILGQAQIHGSPVPGGKNTRVNKE